MPTDVVIPRLHRPDGRIAGVKPLPGLPRGAMAYRPAAAEPVGVLRVDRAVHNLQPLGGAEPIPGRLRTTHHPVAAEPGTGSSRRDRVPQPPTGLRPGAGPGQPISSPGARLRGPPPHTSVAVEGRESRVAVGHRVATRRRSALDARPGAAIITGRAAPSPYCSLPGADAPHRPAAAEPGPDPREWRPAYRPAAASRAGPIAELSRRLATHYPVAAEPGPGPSRGDRVPPTSRWPLSRGWAHPGETAPGNRPPACGRGRTGGNRPAVPGPGSGGRPLTHL